MEGAAKTKLPKKLRDLTDEKYENSNSRIRAAVGVSLPVIDHRRLLVVDFCENRAYYTGYYREPKTWRFRVIVDKKGREMEIVYIDKETKTVKSTTSDTRHEFVSQYIYPEMSKQDEKKLCGYLGANNDGNHGLYALRDIIDEIAAEMTARRREKRGLFAEQDYKLFPDELPDGCKRWIESLARNEKTIVYNKGNTTGRCYFCGERVRAYDRRFKQYEKAVCPNCGADVTCYLKDGAADMAHIVSRFLVPQKNGDIFLLRGFVLLRDPEAEYKNIDDWLLEIERFAFRGKNIGTWRRFSEGSAWDIDRRNDYAYYDRAWIAGFNEAKVGTAAEYVEEKYLREYKMRTDIERWIRYPIIEKLYKAGFTDIAHKMAYSPMRDKDIVNVRAKTLAEFFKLPLGVIRFFGPTDELTITKVDIAQRYTAQGYSGETLRLLVAAEVPTDSVEWLSGYASLKKICGYILEQEDRTADTSRPQWRNVARDYCDYIRELEDLEMNTRDKDRLFPDDLYAAHGETSRLVLEARDAIAAKKRKAEDEAFAKRMKGLKYLEFADKKAGLQITAPLSSEELRAEGQRLHHCVGSYVEKVAQGVTVILFVRKTKDAKKSYYTLEYKDGKIIQCRTHCNEDYRGNAKVKAFLEKWLKYIKKFENKEIKTA